MFDAFKDIVTEVINNLKDYKNNVSNWLIIILLFVMFSGTLYRLIIKFLKFFWNFFIIQWQITGKDSNANNESVIHHEIEKKSSYNNLGNNNLSLIEMKMLELLTKNSSGNDMALEQKLEQKIQFQNLENKMMMKDLEYQMKQKIFEMEVNQKINSLNKNKELEKEPEFTKNDESAQITKELQDELIVRLKEINKNVEDIRFCILSDKEKKTYYNNDEKTLYINPYDLFSNIRDKEQKHLETKN